MSNAFSNVFMSLLIKLLPLILGQVSPVLKNALADAIKMLEDKADQTPNEFDNIFVAFLKEILSVK